jgi:predicted chitinase
MNLMIKISIDQLTKTLGNLTDVQIDSIFLIIKAFEEHGDNDKRKLAYILATAYHESKLLPIKEKRAKPGTNQYATQENYWKDGFYGRGFVQLTWRKNYQLFAKLLQIDLVNNPDLALDKIHASNIIVIGMMQGLFTGVGLKNYFNIFKEDYLNARKIVNGLDRAELIATYYLRIKPTLI